MCLAAGQYRGGIVVVLGVVFEFDRVPEALLLALKWTTVVILAGTIPAHPYGPLQVKNSPRRVLSIPIKKLYKYWYPEVIKTALAYRCAESQLFSPLRLS